MSKRRLYIYLIVACTVGMAWIIVASVLQASHSHMPDVCLFKNVTGVPCPSCGSTRSVVALMHGDINGALFWNPFGLLLVALLLVVPTWMAIDKIRSRSSLYESYRRIESYLSRRTVYIPAIVLVVCNWIWNISKGL